MSDAVVVAAPIVVEARDIDVVAEAFVTARPEYKIRKTNSKTFRCTTLAENEGINWKKGLVYMINRYSKGINLEMWAYSPKGGVHLAEFNPKFEALASDTIKCEPLGHARKLRIQILDTATTEEMTTQIVSFLDTIEPTVAEVRALVPAVEPKAKKAKVEVKAETTVDATLPEGTVIEGQVPAEATVAKKSSKSKSKVKVAA